MKKYRKLPVIVEAVRYYAEDEAKIVDWIGDNAWIDYVNLRRTLHISTPEGIMTANFGDWVIKGVKGEFYPCKDDIFKSTYEEA